MKLHARIANKAIHVVLSAMVMLLGPAAIAQEGDSPDCLHRGCKSLPIAVTGSPQFTDCGTGIGFKVGDVTYTPSDKKCPQWTETVPAHTEADLQTVKNGKHPYDNGTYDITKQNHLCATEGCDGVASCCLPDGPPTILNTKYHCKERDCE
jgi:hypothetical protein